MSNRSMIEIFNHIKNSVNIKWPPSDGSKTNTESVRYSAISGFFFLRFICPAILSVSFPH
jgi:hypothetical protein